MVASCRHMSRAPGSGIASYGKCDTGCGVAVQYEEEELQALALSVMPVEEMEAGAQETARLSAELGDETVVAVQDALVQELLAWFKTFFTWVQAFSVCNFMMTAAQCDQGKMKKGMAAGPAGYQIGITEAHQYSGWYTPTRRAVHKPLWWVYVCSSADQALPWSCFMWAGSRA